MQNSSAAIKAVSDDAPEPDIVPGQEMEDFIYLISHDLRGSVRALLELPQWIAEDLKEADLPVTRQVTGSLDLMQRHTRRLDRMLVDLLTFSRIGRMQQIGEVDLDDALDQSLAALRLSEQFVVHRHLEIRRLRIGERDILTLLCAVLENAVKHHDRDVGEIYVTTGQAGEKVMIDIADDGPGIDQSYRGRVFSPMVTLRPRDEVEGSGMGLAHVKKIATHYGGYAQISARMPAGRGCRVSITLPTNVPHVQSNA